MYVYRYRESIHFSVITNHLLFKNSAFYLKNASEQEAKASTKCKGNLWNEKIASHISEKKKYRKCIQLIDQKKKKKTTNWIEESHEQFSNEDIKLTNTYMKMCSISLIMICNAYQGNTLQNQMSYSFLFQWLSSKI